MRRPGKGRTGCPTPTIDRIGCRLVKTWGLEITTAGDVPDGDLGALAERASVVLVDDEPDITFLLERLLDQTGFEVVGTAADGQQGIDEVAATQPDVVLLDLAMPTLDGEAALPTIVRDAPRTMIVILSANVTPVRARDLFARGAFAVYEKGDLELVPPALAEDLAMFRRVLEGIEAMPSLRRRYQRP